MVPGGLSGFSYGSETESSGTTTYDIEPGTYTVTGNCSGRETEKSIWEIGHLCSITPQKITINDGETGKVLVRSGCGEGDNPGHVTVIVNLTGVNYENFTVKTPTGTFTQITTKLDLPPGTYNFSPTGGVEFKVKDDGKNYSCNNSGTDKYSCSPYADPSTLTVDTVNIYINVNGGGGGGTGKIKVTLEADGSNCTHGTYTDIMKAVINANGNNKNYTGTIQGNPGASTTITVPAGNYVLTNTEFDPTLSCQMADCSIYDEIKVISLTPASVKVEKDKTAEAILKVGCTGDGKKYCIVTLVADEGGTVNPPIPQEVRCNDKMVIAATPDEDYQFSGWTIEVGEAKFDETSTVGATYIIPATDVTARASFKPVEKCSITVIGSKPDSTLLGRPNDSIQVRVSGKGVDKSATLDSSNNFTYKFSGLNCGSVYTVVPTPPSYNSSTISSASYKVSGFQYGTLNGDETSTLSLNVTKLAYLYAGIGQGGGIIGQYWDWRVEAFTSNDDAQAWRKNREYRFSIGAERYGGTDQLQCSQSCSYWSDESIGSGSGCT